MACVSQRAFMALGSGLAGLHYRSIGFKRNRAPAGALGRCVVPVPPSLSNEVTHRAPVPIGLALHRYGFNSLRLVRKRRSILQHTVIAIGCAWQLLRVRARCFLARQHAAQWCACGSQALRPLFVADGELEHGGGLFPRRLGLAGITGCQPLHGANARISAGRDGGLRVIHGCRTFHADCNGFCA